MYFDEMAHLFTDIENRFKFNPTSKWGDHYWAEHIMAENSLFKIGTADNSYAVAVFIEAKDEFPGLAEHKLLDYVNGITKILLEQFGEVMTWGGAWCSSTVTGPYDHLPRWAIRDR